MTTLDEIVAAAGKPKKLGCSVCGDNNAAYLMVRIQRLGANGSVSGKQGESKSKSLSFCEEHAVQKWLELTERLGER